MKQIDIFKEIIARGKRQGRVTLEEINDAILSEFFSLDELECFLDLLESKGVKVIAYSGGARQGTEKAAARGKRRTAPSHH